MQHIPHLIAIYACQWSKAPKSSSKPDTPLADFSWRLILPRLISDSVYRSTTATGSPPKHHLTNGPIWGLINQLVMSRHYLFTPMFNVPFVGVCANSRTKTRSQSNYYTNSSIYSRTKVVLLSQYDFVVTHHNILRAILKFNRTDTHTKVLKAFELEINYS